MQADSAATALAVCCPWCLRLVDTYIHEGVRLMLGHRVSKQHTPETRWCTGGGRHVAGT